MNAVTFVIFLFIAAGVAQECLPIAERVDCHPDKDSTEQRCIDRGCTWCGAGVGVPACFFPRNYGYSMVGEPVNTGSGYRVELERTTTSSLFGGDANNLTVFVDFQSDYRLRIKITDDKPRWEVPLQIDPPSSGPVNPLYDVFFTNDPVFSFRVVRKSSGTVLFDTSLGGFTFADQFISLGIKVPTTNVYGIGENEQKSFRHNFDQFLKWPLWANGYSPIYTNNIYGVHPHYTVLEDDGNAHAVVIVNSNAQEFEMIPAPGIVYRTIGGLLDIYLFLGPTPESTVVQYTEAVGRFPLPPYWSLGFQLCKYGYDHIDKLKEVVDRMIASEIPYDVQYGDIDIMDRELDFTYDPINFAGLPEYVKELKTKGIKFMTILDPIISTGEPAGTYPAFDEGMALDVWIKKADGTPVDGKMWPEEPCYYPDYTLNRTREWWIKSITDFHDVLEFDALWIDMNEPSNFANGDLIEGCPASVLNDPPYLPNVAQETLYESTICPEHLDSVGKHYDTHSLFGWFESEPTIAGTQAAVGNKRTFALSRSTYIGSQRWVTHWLGDNWSTWENLHYSIIGTLQFNLFGMPFVGPDICGHQLDATKELCQRWTELGAFYPFSRNHNANGRPDQDPASFNGEIIESSKAAMNVRYNLMPYLYTLLANHAANGGTVYRAMWFEFPNDPETFAIDRQFLWGSGLLVTPVIDEGMTNVTGYFPDARFFSYYNGQEVATKKGSVTLDAPLEFIPVHVRGGVIIPTQEPAVNTELARQNPLGLIVPLNENASAEGTLYYDAGDNLNPLETGEYFQARYTANNGVISSVVEKNGYPAMANLTLNTVRLMGAASVSSVTVNGSPHTDFTVDSVTKEVKITRLNLTANVPFEITYSP